MALSKIDVANMLTGATPVANGGTALTSGFVNGVDPRPLSKPIIINGDMAVAQRATSVTSHNAVSYTTVDRFKTVCEVGTYTVIQESLTSGAAYLAGFRNALRLDCTTAEATAGSAGDQTTVEQRIEGFNLSAFKKGTSNAEKYTLAFWVKANKTGSNLQVNLRDNTNDRQIGGTYSIASADTWEHKVINFAADTSGPFADVSTAELLIEWFLDGGSNYSGGAVPTAWEAKANGDRNVTNFDLAGNTANDWAITGVQLEVGEFSSTTLPPFQFEDFGDNLRRCQRYFTKIETGGSSTLEMATNKVNPNNGNQSRGVYYLAVPMRAGATTTLTGSVKAGYLGGDYSLSDQGFSTVAPTYGSTTDRVNIVSTYMLASDNNSQHSMIFVLQASSSLSLDAEL